MIRPTYLAVALTLFSAACSEAPSEQQSADFTDRYSTNTFGSCVSDDLTYACEGRSPDGCWCDAECAKYGDCCSDAGDTCGFDECLTDATCGEGYVCSAEMPRDCMPAGRDAATISGEVFGDLMPSEELAHQAWQAACQDWSSRTVQQVGAVVQAVDCGEARIAPSDAGYRYQSTATMVVEAAGVVVITDTGYVGGDAQYRPEDAVDGWLRACSNRIVDLASIYGDRFVAATCTTPTDQDPGQDIELGSSVVVYVSVAPGDMIWVTDFVATDVVEQVTSYTRRQWQAACDSWGYDAALIMGDAMIGHSCGVPVEEAVPGGVRLVSEAVTQVRVPSSMESTMTVAATAVGQLDADLGAAYQTWRDACSFEMNAQREELGRSLIAVGCGTPSDVGVDGWHQLQSDVTVVTAN